MPLSFHQRIKHLEGQLGRSMFADELKLIKLWDLTANLGEDGEMGDGPLGVMEHTGQFKITYTSGIFELCFICSTLRLAPIAVENSEDLVTFLKEPPISLDEMSVRQAVAAAENKRPVVIADRLDVASAA